MYKYPNYICFYVKHNGDKLSCSFSFFILFENKSIFTLIYI